MPWYQIALTIFYLVWLVALLALLYLIWRSSEARLHHVQVMEKMLIEVAMLDAENARRAVDLVKEMISTLKEQP